MLNCRLDPENALGLCGKPGDDGELEKTALFSKTAAGFYRLRLG
jgi:hypothetical protein